jgi:hypothetical protein
MPISEADSRFYNWKTLRKLQTQSQEDVSAHTTTQSTRIAGKKNTKPTLKHT